MSKVVLDMAMSLDGFISGPNGEDHGLHDYFFSPSGNTIGVLEEGFRNTGAIIMGRKTYEIGAAQGGFEDDPYHVPNFVLTSQVPVEVASGAESFTFVTDGMYHAVELAKAAAGEKDVVVGGGPVTAQRFLAAGLLDEIQIHLISTLLGNGKRLFDSPGMGRTRLEKIRVIK